MANYEIDKITLTDGNIVTIGKNDIVLGMESDGTDFFILRYIHKR